jgi:transposase
MASATQPVAATPEPRPPRSEPAKRNSGASPPHLSRVEITVDLADKACPCCGSPLHRIGDDRSEMLDYVPAYFRIRVISRPRYGCRTCSDGVVQALAPDRPIVGGLATEALLAHVLINKYSDHLPLYRQAQTLGSEPGGMPSPARASRWIVPRCATGQGWPRFRRRSRWNARRGQPRLLVAGTDACADAANRAGLAACVR